ncbi:MAG TPA: divalent-cation tolerance protein CutA [Terriglobia bacterium]|nr:divalent-cation tolerance protein CutA [Terriglobia bacterium]
MTEILMVFVTCESKEGEKIAGSVVSEGLAACVNVMPGVRSCYVWEGKLTWSEEVLMVMKTTHGGFERLEQRVRELHSYEVPEIVGVGVEKGFGKYLEWVRAGVRVAGPEPSLQ